MPDSSAARGAGFDVAAMEAALAESSFAGTFHHLRVTASTNTLALEAARAGELTGVWLADEQTAGRGRGGHRWHSAAGDGLYLSVLMRPRLHGSDALRISLAAGLAAKDAVERTTGLVVDIRWPNDLLVTCPDGEARKFGGILTESAMSPDGALSYAVIGIGMNLNHVHLPEELRAIATSLRLANSAVNAPTVAREQLVPVLLRSLERELDALEAEARGMPESEPLLERFERASTWVRGMRVQVAEEDGYTGVTAGLDRDGLLLVRRDTGDGATRTVRFGGVRRVPVVHGAGG